MLDTRPLRSAGFRHLAAAYWVNEFGTWVGEIALTLLVYSRTHSPLGSAALFTTLRSLPAVLSPLVTTRVETLRPRSVLTTLYVMEAVLYSAIAILTHHFSMPAILVLAAIDGCLAVTAKALTRSATAGSLVKAGLLREGNGILNLGLMVSTAGSPIVAGTLVAWQGAASALFVDAVTFLITAVLILTAHGIQIETDRMVGWAGRMRNGMTVLRTQTAVRRLMVATGLIMLLGGIPIPIEVVFVKHTLHAGDEAYGLLLGSWGAGMIVGGAAFTTASNVRLMVVVGIGTSLTAAGYGGLAVAPSLVVACAASAVGGAGNGAGWVAAVTSLQERIPLETQSAIMAVLETMNQVMPAIGFAVGGLLTTLASPRLAYAAAALGVGAVVAVVLLRPVDEVKLGRVEKTDSRGAPPGSGEAQESEASGRTRSLRALTHL